MTTNMDLKAIDPRNLMAEAYRIEGITIWDCRSIFFDWALGLKPGLEPRAAISALLDHYGAAQPDHPMTEVLRAGLEAPPDQKRRGGRAARVPPQG